MVKQSNKVIGPIYAAPVVNCAGDNNVPIIKPIRLFQFILVTALLILTSNAVFGDSPYGPAEGTGILALAGVFFLIILVDLISQCGSDPIPDTPMFLLGILGTVMFLAASVQIIIVSKKDGVTEVAMLLTAACLSIACAFLFLLDVLLIFLYGY